MTKINPTILNILVIFLTEYKKKKFHLYFNDLMELRTFYANNSLY